MMLMRNQFLGRKSIAQKPALVDFVWDDLVLGGEPSRSSLGRMEERQFLKLISFFAHRKF